MGVTLKLSRTRRTPLSSRKWAIDAIAPGAFVVFTRSLSLSGPAVLVHRWGYSLTLLWRPSGASFCPFSSPSFTHKSDCLSAYFAKSPSVIRPQDQTETPM